MTANYTTSVIIVTYNAAADIEDCVRQLAHSPSLEVIVVDNCSTDATRGICRGLHADGVIDQLIESVENDGFARAVNRGIRASTADGVFLLNPDARIDGTSIDKLRELGQRDAKIGVIAPLVDGGPHVPTLSAGRQPRLWPLFTHFSGLARAFPSVRLLRGRHLYRAPHSYTQDVEWVSGCALYITPAGRAAAPELSEQWFMYGEDIEYAQRVLDGGLRVVMTADVRATHEIGASVNQTDSPVSTMWARNTYDYYRRQFHPGWLRRFLWRSIFSAGLSARALLMEARSFGRASPATRARARRFRRFSAAVWKS